MSTVVVEPMSTEALGRFAEDIDAITGSVRWLPVPSFPSDRTTYRLARVLLWAASLREPR